MHTYLCRLLSSLPEICVFPFSVVEYSWLESRKSYNPELFVTSGSVQMSILQRCEAVTMVNNFHIKMMEVMRCRRSSISIGNLLKAS